MRLGASQVSQAKMYTKTSFNKDVFYRRFSCLVCLFVCLFSLLACLLFSLGLSRGHSGARFWRVLHAIPEVE